ncbi:sodium-dependent transporter [Salinilacihabitans rarus]|uniref:sodium-dependent transporter n=1 Tax=Salinilacihabitans rarus TaxID=2961596 RepID=UPI0020C91ED7|nr:sodium-dependent transporter [Salinilacihabitans rarus]
MSSEVTRETWASRAGFILAAVGSAVGLGNVWRFPFQVAQEGGGAFLAIYLLFVLTVGFPAILAEFVVGRHTKRNPVSAVAELGGGAWRYVGWIFVVTGVIILSYYSVVASWTLRYVLFGLGDGYVSDVAAAGAQFDAVATGLDAVGFHALFMLAAITVVAAGIERGIELTVKVMVPAIVVVAVGMAVYAFTLDGAGAAYAYYLAPDVEVIAADWRSILPAAAGQAFFTLSLGMGTMVTYASYLGEDRNLAADGAVIVGLDTLIALVVGLIVFPVFFTAGVDPADPGPGAIFVGLTSAFADVPFGRLVGLAFFVTVAVAALSSAISILEVAVSFLVDERGIDRKVATLGVGGGVFLLGVPSALDLVLLDLFDTFADRVLLVAGALLLVVLVGWLAADVAREELEKGIGDLGPYGDAWIWLVRLPVAITLVVALVLGVSEYVEFLTGDFADWLAALR